jgi:outer membrane lipoprotein-sorting protein
MKKTKCRKERCDGDHTNYSVGWMIAGLLLIVCILTWVSTSPTEKLGQGFAKQTCMDKGMTLDKVEWTDYSNNTVNIICKDVQQEQHIDGSKYIVVVKG